MEDATPVLIVGAGPTGLNLALSLARRRVPFQIISEAEGPGEHSRAMVVQARTLEFYDQYGFADQVVSEGVVMEAAHLREAADGTSHEVLTFSFKDLGDGLSPFPFALAYPQDDHERFLLRKLGELGITVEWLSRLESFSQDSTGVRATVACGDATSTINAAYICGCDGARSRVREAAGIGFPGESYQQLFYVADVSIDRGFERDLHISLGEHILSLIFPVRRNGMQRLIGLVSPEMSENSAITFEDIRSQVEPLLDIKVKNVNWFSTYRVHHRVADHFRAGRAFLLGDAGHIHSPVGGQGMNTGIGDAVNLGWKLAQVLQQRAAASILDSYEPERLTFARSLVSTTDRAFTPLVSDDLEGKLTRKIAAPLVVGIATRFAFSRHAIFGLVSQIRIHYPDSPLSEGKAGQVRGGDRLPWLSMLDNFAPLRSLDWQLHLYGDATQDMRVACESKRLDLRLFAWNDEAKKAGFERDAAYLIRPDGHVALAMSEQNSSELKSFVDRHALKFESAAQ
jgi:2-polyprenyl-6-methoxyphenol hydroxylase-like FAD-dependent oxidoreductase